MENRRTESQGLRTRWSFWWEEQQHSTIIFIRASYCSYILKVQINYQTILILDIFNLPLSRALISFKVRDINRSVEPDRSLFS